MGPNATMTALLTARRSGDHDRAFELAHELLHWLDDGGGPPDGFTTEEAYIEALDVLLPDPDEPDPAPLADEDGEPSRPEAAALTSPRVDR